MTSIAGVVLAGGVALPVAVAPGGEVALAVAVTVALWRAVGLVLAVAVARGFVGVSEALGVSWMLGVAVGVLEAPGLAVGVAVPTLTGGHQNPARNRRPPAEAAPATG